MIVASHQPHYFPWLGYLDKMAKSDVFIISDEVQLEKKSPMTRNLFLANSGTTKYLSLSIDKEGFMDKKNSEILLSKNIKAQDNHRNFILNNYKKCEYFDEIWTEISHIFDNEYKKLIDIDMETIFALRKMLNINTEIIYKSSLKFDRSNKKSDSVLVCCEEVGGDIYLSGNGARKYLKVDEFAAKGIQVVFQDFKYPQYRQVSSEEFIPNLSSLDLLFNCGIQESRRIFWENVNRTKEVIR